MDSIAVQYLLLTYGGCLGTYQIAAVYGGFKGLWFFRNSLISYLVGFAILVGVLAWFIISIDLKVPHEEVSGSQQLGYFLLGAFLALITTFVLSSINNASKSDMDDSAQLGKGLEDLNNRTV